MSTSPTSQSLWVAARMRTLAEARRRGDSLDVADLLADAPEVDVETTIRLIYEDVWSRRDAGEEVPTVEVLRRFPRYEAELGVLFDCDRLLTSTPRATCFPEIGDDLGPYRVIAELGRGASGRTYLAAEPGLADRLVVLKVVPDDQNEHLSLARLQNTHIIPLFSERVFPERGVRVLCMPYLGGTSLDRLLEEVAKVPLGQRRGVHLLEALDRVQASFPAPPVVEGPCRRYLEGATWTQAVCWVTACLADALHAAHLHGLVHMDVKPANVLLAGDGLPMLLDFHLARHPIQAGEVVTDRLGGTPGWTAPEQEEAMASTRLGRPLRAAVDTRCDVYALGLLLREALDGHRSDPVGIAARSSRWIPRSAEVGTGLTDLVRRCLEPSPADRYLDAATLADDLRRHLNDLPLRGVPNRSLSERWRKWRRSRPGALWRGTAWGLSLGGLAAAALLGAAIYLQHQRNARDALQMGRKLRLEHRHAEAIAALERGVQNTRGMPGLGASARDLEAELALTRGSLKADNLHRLAELVRFRYGIDPPAADEARSLARHLRALWNDRGAVLDVGPGADRGVRDDLLELAVVWADLHSRFASASDRDRAGAEAIDVLDDARAECGPSPALDRLRRALAVSLGRTTGGDRAASPPANAWEHYDLGRSFLREGRVTEALAEFEQTLAERPNDFWPNFYQGTCAFRLGRYEEAVGAFRTCSALAPTSPDCAYNQALALEALGRVGPAERAYARALKLDPRFASAAINRGILAFHSGRPNDAVADFERAALAASDDASRARAHFNWALAASAQGAREIATRHAEQAANLGSSDARAFLDASAKAGKTRFTPQP